MVISVQQLHKNVNMMTLMGVQYYLQTKGNVWVIQEDQIQHYNMVITNFDFQEFSRFTLIVGQLRVKRLNISNYWLL